MTNYKCTNVIAIYLANHIKNYLTILKNSLAELKKALQAYHRVTVLNEWLTPAYCLFLHNKCSFFLHTLESGSSFSDSWALKNKLCVALILCFGLFVSILLILALSWITFCCVFLLALYASFCSRCFRCVLSF